MRLTLRTLLAYLDNILESGDADNIGKRIQESDVASALMHRIRDVMRRLRLEAPGVEENRGGLDPNTVAEYLDHVLPDDRVPDFERICLESDKYLAEVASCHQILALVLGEPAEIDPASREHMYALPQVASELEAMEQQEPEDLATGDGHPSTEPPLPPPRPRPVVPDYLREPDRRRRFPWAIAIVVLIGVMVIGGMLANHYGLFGKDSSVAKQTTDASETTPGQTVDDQEAPKPQPPEDQQDQLVTEPPTIAPPSGQVPNIPGPIDASQVPGQANEPVEGGPALPTEPGDAVTTLPDPSVIQPLPAPPAAGTTTEPSGPIEPAIPDQSGDVVSLPKPPGPTEEPSEPDTGVNESPLAPDELKNLGRFVSEASENQVLLQWDANNKTWERMPAGGNLSSNSDLLSLPVFRPLITLVNGLNVQLRGGTQLELKAVEGQDIPRVTLKYGRLVIHTEGKPENRLMLNIGNRSGTLIFVDPESRAAVEIIRTHIPGNDPINQPAGPVVNVYALSGRFIWEPDDGLARIEFKTPSCLTLGPTGGGSAVPVDQFPEWYISGKVSNLDRRAAKSLEKAIPVGRPVSLGLKEQQENRKIEIRRLASRSLGYIGEFEPLVTGLDRPEEKPLWTWPDHIEELQQALVRGPDVARQVRSALDNAFGEEGAKIYRMLWGYSASQLVDGQDAVLVKALGSELLAARVLSFENLHEITGLGLYYRPNDSLSKRKKAIREWEKRQKKGEIRFRAAVRNDRIRPQKVPDGGPPKKDAPPLNPTLPTSL